MPGFANVCWVLGAARDDPGNGSVNYDTFPYAMFNILVVTTMANWTDQMFPLWDATSSLVAVYYVSLIIIAAYFAMNIFAVGSASRRVCVLCQGPTHAR